MHVGRYLNGYEYSRRRTARLERLARRARTRTPSTTTRWRVNENGSLVSPYPDAGAPGRVPDRLLRAPRRRADRAAPPPGDRPFYLQLWFVAPHRGGPRDADDPTAVRHALPRPAPPRPVRDRPVAAAAELRRGAASATSRRWWPTGRASTPRRSAAIEENWRQELESLQAVDEAWRARRRHAGPHRRARQHADRLHVGQRLHARRAPRPRPRRCCSTRSPIRVPLVMRGPGIPRRLARPAPGGQHRRRAHDRRRRRAPPPGASRTGARCCRCSPTAPPGGAATSCWRTATAPTACRPTGRSARTASSTPSTSPPGEYELYDLERDPYELRSLDETPAYDAVRSDLAKRLRALKRCAGRGCQKRPGAAAGRALRRPRPCARATARGATSTLRIAGRDRRRVTDGDVRRTAADRPRLERCRPRS